MRTRHLIRALGSAVAATSLIAPILASSSAGAEATPRQWTAAQLALAPGATAGSVNSVSCSGPSSCVAVGSALVNDVLAPSFSVESGGHCPEFRSVDPTGAATGNLLSVSCWSTLACVAVGDDFTKARPLAFRLHGDTWTELALFHASGALGEPDSVSCPSPRACVVVGMESATAQHAPERALIDTWNQGIWRATSFAVPPTTVEVRGLSCTAIASCAALVDASQQQSWRTLLERERGSKWTRSSPPGWSHAHLRGLRCPTTSSCVATGSSGSGSVASVQAHGWGLTTLSAGTGSPGQIGSTTFEGTSASCVSGSCVITGIAGIEQSDGFATSPLWTYTRRAWASSPAPSIRGTIEVQLMDSACTSTGCVAVGGAWKQGSGEDFYQVPAVAARPRP